MRKYEFRLEPVLKHREAREEQAALEQARAHEEYLRHYDTLCNAREKLARAAQENHYLNPFDFFNNQIYCDYMAQEIRKQEAIVDKSRKNLEKCRKNLIKAMQDRSVMERLKEKQIRSYNIASAMHEQKETDDLATRQFLRRNS